MSEQLERARAVARRWSDVETVYASLTARAAHWDWGASERIASR